MDAAAPVWIDGIGDIADQYDAYLVDLWGVVHNGSVAFPWAVRALEELRRRGKPVVFLSNSSRRRETNLAALAKLGVRRELFADLITSGDEAWRALHGVSCQDRPAAVGLPRAVLAAERILVFGNGADDAQYMAGLPGRCSVPLAEAEMLLARGCAALSKAEGEFAPATWHEQETVLSAAAERGLPMLVANPDSVRPDGADSPMPGRLARRYVELGGPEPHFIGKPHGAVFQTALLRLSELGVPEGARVCMIGDSAWHDVRGARAAGLDVTLLCSGVHSASLGVPQAPAAPRRPAGARLEAFLGALQAEEAPTSVTAAFSWDASGLSPIAGRSRLPRVLACGLACVDLAQELESFPEPDAKVRATGTSWLCGGNAANTACALAQLGTPVALLSKVGNDAMGDLIIQGLRHDGVDDRLVARANAGASAFTSVLVDRATGSRTCVNTPMAEELSVKEVESLLVGEREGGDDCAPSGLLGPEVQLVHLDCRHPGAAIRLAEAALDIPGMRISIDVERPREGLDELLPRCTAIFCSEAFPKAFTGVSGLPGALAALLDRFPRADFAVATRGSRGSLLLARDPELTPLGGDAVQSAGAPVACCCGSFGPYATVACDAWPLSPGGRVVDSTGAGDVFIGGFLHAWLDGKPLAVALATGSWVAAQKLQVQGARLGPNFDASKLPM